MYRKPTTSAVAAVAVASLCLVGAGTAGAVAGQLIGSDDIARHGVEKRNIAPGAVNWKRLTATTQAQIQALAGEDGAQGPVGPAGERGPRGPEGDPGSDGADGADGAGMVGWNLYETGYDPESGTYATEMTPYLDEVTLPETGSYLVTVNGFMSGPGVIFVGGVGNSYDFIHGCFGTAPVGESLPFASCSSSFTVEADAGDVLPVSFEPQVFVEEGGFGAFAEVSVVRVAGTVPRVVDTCGVAPLNRSVTRGLAQALGKDAARSLTQQVC